MDFRIEPMKPSDWPGVSAVFGEGIASGDATFETAVPPWEQWNAAHLPHCRLVARGREGVLGWAALSPVSGRCVYGGVAEVSIYVAEAHRRQGIGRALLEALGEESERSGLWTLQAGIFPENLSSIALHRKAGFREVGRRERLGRMQGRWRDIVLMERRSGRVGMD